MGRLFDNNAANYMSRGSVDFGLNGATACSIGFWIKLNSTQAGFEQKVFHKQIADGWNTATIRFGASSSAITWGVENQTSGVWPSCVITAGLSLGVWTRVLCTWGRNAGTSADFVTYYNGIPQAFTFTAHGYSVTHTPEETSNNLYYGLRAVTLVNPLDAALAWMCVWNRQLTAQEALIDLTNPRNITNGLISRVPIGGSDVDEAFGGSMTVNGTLQDITGGEPIQGYEAPFLVAKRPRPFAPGLAR